MIGQHMDSRLRGNDGRGATHLFDSGILREYDIRGTVGGTLKEADCYFVGRAFGTLLRRAGGRTVAAGFDGRESSSPFCNEVIRGLNDCGLEVENAGLGPTPRGHFSLKPPAL